MALEYIFISNDIISKDEPGTGPQSFAKQIVPVLKDVDAFQIYSVASKRECQLLPGINTVFSSAAEIEQLGTLEKLYCYLLGLVFGSNLQRYYSPELLMLLKQKNNSNTCLIIDHYTAIANLLFIGRWHFRATVLVAHDCYSLYFARSILSYLPLLDIRSLANFIRFFFIENIIFRMFDKCLVVSQVDRACLADTYHLSSCHYQPIAFSSYQMCERSYEEVKTLIVPGGRTKAIISETLEFLHLLARSASRCERTFLWFPRDSARNSYRDYFARTIERLDLDISIIGWVEDYHAFLDQDWVYVYPKRSMAGIQTKIGEALSYCLPVIGHKNAMSVFGGKPGHDYISCNTSEEMLESLFRLREDSSARFQMGRNARRLIEEMHGQDRSISVFLDNISYA